MTAKVKKDAFCMILSPLGEKSEPVRETLLEILLSLGIKPVGMKESEAGMGLITENIFSEIAKADLIIADITGGNPNVMYELGFAHALKKPVLHIVEKGANSIPFDLAGSLYYVYDTGESKKRMKEKFSGMIKSWALRNLSYA
jgi:nucleoside 2-deoxyribosyltransferase